MVSGQGQSTSGNSDSSSDRVVDLEERSWLQRHCRGDRAAFAELVNAYRAPVYTYLARCGIDPSSRDDLFQDVFLSIHTAASSYQPAYPLRPWVFAIVANKVRNFFRSESQRSVVVPQSDPPDFRDTAPSAEGQALLKETVDWLESAIAALPFEQREVLLLTTVRGLREREVADILQAPLNTIKTRLRRARLALAAQRVARHNESGESHDAV